MRYLTLTACLLAAAVSGELVVAESTDAETLFKQAEDLRLGLADGPDLEQAALLYEEAAAQGKNAALYRLGQIYLNWGNTTNALRVLSQAEQAGSQGAGLLLAEGHVTGRFGELSKPEDGLSKLEAMAASPDGVRAAIVLAELHEAGRGVISNPAKALAYYEQAAKSGDPEGLRALGLAYLEGRVVERDPDEAVTLLSHAAAAGSDYAQRDLGKALIAANRPEEAMRAFEKAVTLKVPGASAELANGHYRAFFGDASDKRNGASLLKSLAEAGDVHAARYALRHHERKSRRINNLDLARVLEQMERRVDNGDPFAAAILARSLRTIYWLIPDNRARHARLIENHPHLFAMDELTAERVWAAYDPNDHRASRERAWQIIGGTDGDGFSGGLLRLRAIEQQAYVYALKKEFSGMDRYQGPIDGLADRRFIQLLLQYCADQGYYDVCIHGPLTYEASRLITQSLEAQRIGQGGSS